MSIDCIIDNGELPNKPLEWLDSIDISNISIWEKSPNNYGLWNDFSEIILLEKKWDITTISINGRIFTVFWDSNLNQPKSFSIENNGKKTTFISWTNNRDWYITLIWKDTETFRVENIENPLIIVNNSVYIIYSEENWVNENEKWYLAISTDNSKHNTKIYWIRNIEWVMEFKDIQERDSVILWNWYYANSDDIYNLNSNNPVTQLPFNWDLITDVNHNDWNSFFGKYKDETVEFCFFPLESNQIPHIVLFWEIIFTDKEWFILEWALKWYKIENIEWYKIDDDYIFIWLTDKKWNISYVNLNVLKNGLSSTTFNIENNLYRFKWNDEFKQLNLVLNETDKDTNIRPFSCIDNPESKYNWYPILEERVYTDWGYNVWFKWENWVDYAFILTKSWDKKLLAINWKDIIEIDTRNRFEEKSSHSENLKNWVRVVWLHTNIWLVVLTNNQSTTSNYRYYVLREDWVLIYIWSKDNIWWNISKWELSFNYQIQQNENLTSKILFWKNWLPLVNFKENKTFIVWEYNWKNRIYSLKVVDNYRQLTPESIIEIPEWEDVEKYFRDYIENNIQLIPWTDFLYTPWRSFRIWDKWWWFQFVWIDWRLSISERIEDLPEINIWWKSYYILANNTHYSEYFLYSKDWKKIKQIKSLRYLSIKTSSCSSISREYSDKVGLNKTECSSYIYPKANDLLPGNIRLALVNDNWVPRNQYVIHDEKTNTIIWKIPTSQAPIKTSNPDEFIIILSSDENNWKYSTFNIKTWEIKEKVIPKWLILNPDNLTEWYKIGWTWFEILMKDWKTKIVEIDWKKYYETNEYWEFLGKKIIHLFDSKNESLLPFYNNNWILSPVFEDIAWNIASILIKNWILEYRFSYQSTETKIPLDKIVTTWWWEYVQFVNSNRENEEKDKIVSFWNNSLRIWRSLNDYFNNIESNYKAYIVEENESWLNLRLLPQIEVITCSLEYTSLLINWIEINLYFNYMESLNTDNTQSLWILEKYLKKLLWSMIKKYPIIVVGEVKDEIKKLIK